MSKKRAVVGGGKTMKRMLFVCPPPQVHFFPKVSNGLKGMIKLTDQRPADACLPVPASMSNYATASQNAHVKLLGQDKVFSTSGHLQVLDLVADLHVTKQVLALHDISENSIAAIQQVRTGRRQLRLLQQEKDLG